MATTALGEFGPRIDRSIGESLAELRTAATELSPESATFIDTLTEYCLRGGKRVRATLLARAYEAVGGEPDEAIFRIGAGLELIAAFTLIHDDLIDGDDVRRGGPAFHAVEGVGRGERRLAMARAIIAGDILAVSGLRTVLTADFPLAARHQAMEILLDGLALCGLGQHADLEMESGGAERSSWREMVRHKTTAFSVEAPLLMGALLGGAPRGELDGWRRLAHRMGEAYQLTDDLLGVVGDTRLTGKSAASDIRRGKQTFIAITAFARSSPAQREVIGDIFGNAESSPEDVERVRRLFVRTGAVDAARERAEELVARAKLEIDTLGMPAGSAHFFRSFCDFTVQREQ